MLNLSQKVQILSMFFCGYKSYISPPITMVFGACLVLTRTESITAYLKES